MLTDNLLRGQHVHLTALEPDDLPTVTAWYQDTTFLRLLDAVAACPRTKDDLAAWIERSRKSDQDVLLAVRLNTDNRLVGYVELDGILWNQQVASLSIAIGAPADRGRGYGLEGLQLALRFAFDELNLHRVGITVFSYNQPAIALYERLGFQREGILREFLARDGRRFDMFCYGLLRPEWRDLSASAPEPDPIR